VVKLIINSVYTVQRGM